ncbi:MAG: tol-pal system protein YbgF [Methylococcales bacterium]
MRISSTIFLALIVSSSHADSDSERLDRLEQRLSSKTYMKMWQSVDQLHNEMRDLRGELEQQTFQIQQIQQQQKKMYLDLDQRMRTIEQSNSAGSRIDLNQLNTADQELGNDSPGAIPTDQSVHSKLPTTNADNKIISADYDKALQTLREGRYAESAELFKKIVTRHPNSELADNAQYWLAETRYINREFDAATSIFQQLINHYPTSSKVPDALLKIAFIRFELNDINIGKQQLKALIERYPKSSAALLAQQRLNNIQ